MHRPDCKTAHHPRAVTGMELIPLHQLHWLWKNVWQHRHWVLMEVIKTLRSTRKAYKHHQKLPSVTVLVSAGHLLGHEDIHSTETEWHTVDTLDKARWPRLCKWSSLLSQKVLCISINNFSRYLGDNILWNKFSQVLLSKKWSPWQIFLKINPIHTFTITDNFLKFCVYWSTDVGAIQAATYYDTNLIKSPSQKSDPLDRFFWKSIPSMLLLLLTTCISIYKCKRYPGDNTLWHRWTDGLKTLYPQNFVAWV
jgi:hypothetical protein